MGVVRYTVCIEILLQYHLHDFNPQTPKAQSAKSDTQTPQDSVLYI